MKASELIGHHVIRRSVVIVPDEGRKIMDPSYTDPNKPAFISDYDYIDNKIYLVSHDGIETVLTGSDYNDDKWVSVDNGEKYDNVIIPDGYMSIYKLYEYADQASKYSNTRKSDNDDIDSGIDTVLNYLKNGLSNGITSIPIKYYDSEDHFNIVNIKMVSDLYGAGYIFSRCSNHEYSSNIVRDPNFAIVVNKILDNGIDRLASLNLLKFVTRSSFGYNGINKIAFMARYAGIDALIIVFSIIDMYSVEYNAEDDTMYINPMDLEDISGIDHSYAMAFLGTEESVDLATKVNETKYYECLELKLG